MNYSQGMTMSCFFHMKKHQGLLSPYLIRRLSSIWHNWLSLFLESLPSCDSQVTPSLSIPRPVLVPVSLSLSGEGEWSPRGSCRAGCAIGCGSPVPRASRLSIYVLSTSVLVVFFFSISSISVALKTVSKLTNLKLIFPAQTSPWTPSSYIYLPIWHFHIS